MPNLLHRATRKPACKGSGQAKFLAPPGELSYARLRALPCAGAHRESVCAAKSEGHACPLMSALCRALGVVPNVLMSHVT